MANYGWLADFELLKHSWHDILNRLWAVQANHEMAIKHFKLVGAQGEIDCLNIEIWCWQKWVNGEDSHLLNTALSLEYSAPYTAAHFH